MTVDVEDYFHARRSTASCRAQSWDERESRVVANTDRLLELFDRARRAARTFFVLGWVAERFPGAGARRSRRAATRSRRTATITSWSTR